MAGPLITGWILNMVGEQLAFYFTHFWGKGPARELARGLRSALDAQKAIRPEGH